MMDIEKQVNLLNGKNSMPLKLKFLKNFIRFLNSNLTNLSATFLMVYILIFKKDMPYRVYFFKSLYSNAISIVPSPTNSPLLYFKNIS